MTNEQYEALEHARAVGTLNRLAAEPLKDRQEARTAYYEAMRDNPELVAERIEWIIDGTHGYGPMLIARAILNGSDRSNKAAQLSYLVAGFEWICPARFARDAYLKLSTFERDRIDTLINQVIKGGE